MLPEGAGREELAQRLKVHIDNEFPLMIYLGCDLPGALIASPVDPADIPGYALQHRPGIEPVPIPRATPGFKSSLAGVQSKFSMRDRDGTYDVPPDGELGDWIVKPPSPRYGLVYPHHLNKRRRSMDTLFGIAVVGLWIGISVMGLKRAYGSRGPSPRKTKPEADDSIDG